MPVNPLSPTFQRQRVLTGFGVPAQERLSRAHVLVIGAGGLASTLLPVLAAAGVGSLTIVDDDTVAESNLHRQTMHTPGDIGRSKAVSATIRLASLAPDAELRAVEGRFDAVTAEGLLHGVDVLVDASDNPATVMLADRVAAERGIPLVWGSALGYAGQAGVAWDARGTDYRDLFPHGPDSSADTCDMIGVLPSVCAVSGAFMATEALKLLTGIGEPLIGRVAAYDARTGRTREIAYRRDESARAAAQSIETTPLSSDDQNAVSPEELRDLLTASYPPLLIDVREPWEADIAAIPGNVLIPLTELPRRAPELDTGHPIVLYCHRGTRSRQALDQLLQLGFSDVRHLTGGIDAWAVRIDPTASRY